MKLFFKLVVCFSLVAFNARALIVNHNDVASAIENEFKESGIDREVELEIFGGETSFDLGYYKTFKIMVSNLRLDEDLGRFSSLVEIFADGKPFKTTDITGRYYLMTEAYVPVVFLGKGEVITEDKLRKIKIRANRLKLGNVVELEMLVDKEVKKPLKEGKIINDREIGNKIAIKKGEIVTIVYRTDKMQISAKVEALTEGGIGEKILVRNTKSKKELYGTIIDKNTVEAEAGL